MLPPVRKTASISTYLKNYSFITIHSNKKSKCLFMNQFKSRSCVVCRHLVCSSQEFPHNASSCSTTDDSHSISCLQRALWNSLSCSLLISGTLLTLFCSLPLSLSLAHFVCLFPDLAQFTLIFWPPCGPVVRH